MKRYLPLIILGLLTLGGCRKRVKPKMALLKEKEEKVEEAKIEEKKEKVEKKIPLELHRIFFDFDKYDIRPDAAQTLRENAKVLKAYPDVKILIEGHCDERGTDEYNMALGWKRAEAAKRYLESLGISPSRMSTISYGEERPLDPHNYDVNRRCEFVIR